jgi:hypothetical protein
MIEDPRDIERKRTPGVEDPDEIAGLVTITNC